MTDVTQQFRTCITCGETKPLTQFYQHGGTKRCRDCERRFLVARYQPFRDWVDRYKLERGCTDCGYNAHAEALDFDHLPGTDKIKPVAHLVIYRNMERIKAEVAKCEVVCANCHRVRTSTRRESAGGQSNRDWDLRRRGLDHDDAQPPFEQLRLES